MLEHIAQPAPADTDDEYIAATTASVVFDHSDFAKLLVTGPDAPMFLSNLSTNDIKNLPFGAGCESYFCDARAKALYQAWIYNSTLPVQRNAFWVETLPGYSKALLNHLDKYLISEAVEFQDVTDAYSQYHLTGPLAKNVLDDSDCSPFPEFPHYGVIIATFGTRGPASIRRHDWLGMPGYDIVCHKEQDQSVWKLLTDAGAVPAGEETFHTLRIEAGRPFYGIDIDENRFVMEVGGAERAVSYTKGCYLGQEPIVMARDRAGHAPRSFVRIKFPQGIMLPTGSKLFLGADEIGVVTSVCQSPRWQATLALGYVKWKHCDPGTILETEIGTARVAGEVLGE